jgi:hypothetical protein
MTTQRPEAPDLDAIAFHVEGTCAAPPPVVYATLADLRSHLVWGGTQQPEKFRLLTLDAPPGPATPGTVFTSTGIVPPGRFYDRSVVTAAEPPRILEFRTSSVLAWGGHKSREATLHRYAITPTGRGSRVSYAFRGTGPQPPETTMRIMLAIPGLRRLFLVRIRRLLQRGLDNMLRLAETRATNGSA